MTPRPDPRVLRRLLTLLTPYRGRLAIAALALLVAVPAGRVLGLRTFRGRRVL